jgi:hypothetical protein
VRSPNPLSSLTWLWLRGLDMQNATRQRRRTGLTLFGRDLYGNPGIASPTIPSWNHLLAWLRDMETLRSSMGTAARKAVTVARLLALGELRLSQTYLEHRENRGDVTGGHSPAAADRELGRVRRTSSCLWPTVGFGRIGHPRHPEPRSGRDPTPTRSTSSRSAAMAARRASTNWHSAHRPRGPS